MPGSVYHPFEAGDLLHTVVHAQPVVSLVSGTNGWRGNLGTSASLSLYGGIRSRRDVSSGMSVTSGLEIYPLDPLDTHSIDKVIFVSGSYPSTGSVNYARCRRAPIPDTLGAAFSMITNEDWYEEHFSPLERLYEFYSGINTNYFTGSYDYYCVRFKQDSSNSGSAARFNSCSLDTMSSSFTLEAQIKPLSLTGSRDFMVMSQQSCFSLYLDGSTGRLSFNDGSTTVTSSLLPTKAVWQHIGVSAGDGFLTFYSDGVPQNKLAYGGSISHTTNPLVVGAQAGTGFNKSFDGFIFETRCWSVSRTNAELSGTALTTVKASGNTNLVHYGRFNDGSSGTLHGYSPGLGVFDYSLYAHHAQLFNFGITLPRSPSWHPNDDVDFYPLKRRIDNEVKEFRVVHVPSMFYGRQIATGSVRLTCKAYNNQGITRVLQDDGRGSLYLSGSITNGLSGEEYAGVRWNKVGNVFYTEGLIVITDPALQDFGHINYDSTVSGTFAVEFKGVTRTPSKVFMCRLGPAQGNASNNPSYSYQDTRGDDDPTNDRWVLNRPEATTWISAVGIYNDQHELVAVAKLATPIRKREKDKLDIRLRMDF